MLYDCRLPRVSPHMAGALIECLHAQPGTRLEAGSKLLDISVDLGGAYAQDCPLISYYRVVMREPLWLRSLAVTPGTIWDTDNPVALFSTDPDEPMDAPAARAARVETAAIFRHPGMWSGGAG